MRTFAATALASSIVSVLLCACGGSDQAQPPPSDSGVIDSAPSDAGDAGDAASDAPTSGTTVTTDKGDVVGVTSSDGKVNAFLGIPYAAAPVGDLRWKPPAPAPAWTTPRMATSIGLACPQVSNALTGAAPPNGEDCLFLNVWTPTSATNAPVMVFIHGGSFTFGQGGDPLYDGAALSHLGVIVVTINYRLGALGFMAHPALSAEDAHGSSGNYGLLDQQAALGWVKTNIAAFHGDPTKVTIFGESAGAISVGAHIVSPLAAGLFSRALSESGTVYLVTEPLKDPSTPSTVDSAEEYGAAFATKLGCTDASPLACLRGKAVADILSAQGNSLELTPGVTFSPNVDGYVLPSSPILRMTAGQTNDVPYLLGTNADEATLFDSTLTITNDTEYRAAVAAEAPTLVDSILAIYPSSAYPTPKDAFNAFMTEALFVCPARFVARASASRVKQTYLYQYTHVDSVGAALGWGAFHSSELPLVFGNFTGVFSGATDVEKSLSASMMGYWTRFAATGDPNDPSGAALAWPQYTEAADQNIVLGDTISVEANLVKDHCDALEKLAD